MKKCETCGHEPQHIKNVFELLQLVSEGIDKQSRVLSINDLEVRLFEDGNLVLISNVPTVLKYFANDIYWNEEYCWRDANFAEVSVL